MNTSTWINFSLPTQTGGTNVLAAIVVSMSAAVTVMLALGSFLSSVVLTLVEATATAAADTVVGSVGGRAAVLPHPAAKRKNANAEKESFMLIAVMQLDFFDCIGVLTKRRSCCVHQK